MGTDGENKLTPMMLQYRQVKGETPAGAVLLFRMGDFYEMFFEDAQKASPILDVTLTQRAGVPMCGIPYHALDNYLPRLLEAGLKVAIAEQVEDPSLAKGLVKRKVTRVITPGTMLDGAMLSPKQNNFLTGVMFSGGRFGLAFLDISTGDFGLMELPGRPELETELHRLQTRECLLPEALLASWEREKSFPYAPANLLWTPVADWLFSFDCANELLQRHFSVASLDGFGCRGLNAAVGAAGAILHYASENLRQSVGHVRRLRCCHSSEYMVLDNISQRNLELVELFSGGKRDGTLLSVLDETKTPMGSRLLRDWLLRPLAIKDAITARLDAVDSLRDEPLTLAELRETVAGIRDLERITARINVGSANARDMLALAKSLEALPGVKLILSHFDTPLLAGLSSHLHDFDPLSSKIRAALQDDPPISLMEGNLIRQGYNAALDELRSAASEGKGWLASIQTKEQERTGIKSLKVRYNKVFGYYIEISKSNLQYAPSDYIRKQTLANCERFITPELKEIETKILGAEDKSVALEYELFQELRNFALTFTAEIQESAAAIAALDALSSLAECARKYNYCRPHITEEPIIDIKAGRHPVLDAAMKSERFVPNDLLLDGDENRMMIITGPNMAGKSTYIRQSALLVLMAQMGSFIPASSATIGLVDRIFTRVGAADDLSRGQSTFMVEMVETANILHHATNRSLVILDEIGRGTSTFDGLSIAWAVAEYLHDLTKSRSMFATHYHELTELSITRPGVKNYNVAVKEYGDQVIFLRQIIPGGTDKSYGIHVAKLAGLPPQVLSRANEILDNLENNAIAEAGQPALAAHHTQEEKSNYAASPKRPKKQSPPSPENIQPSLFDL